jgi:hypothetical protein
MRLILIGDDEALEILAELSRHLDYFEVSRSDELPERTLDNDDHLIIGAGNGRLLLESALRHGIPGYAALLPEARTAGKRAILAAAELVTQGE